MRVKHSPPSGKSEVHVGKKGGKTNCGFDTTENPSHWTNVNSSTIVTCAKNGCKNQ